MKTTLARLPKGDERDWVVVDAAGQPLGRVAVRIANMLRGRNKAIYTPHVDTGAFVVVINASRVKLTGRKEERKVYADYSGYRGGLKETSVAMMRERHPDRIIKRAVRGMMPKNTQSREMFSRLKVYAGESHPHAAQNPVKA